MRTNIEFQIRPEKTNGIRVLLVEDEPANSAILASYLENAGYLVDEAPDGIAAWKILEEKPSAYRLIVTDKRMPNMNGLELAARIKADKRLSNIPVIMQTGDTSQDEFLKGIKTGVYYYLAKPYDETTLLALVRSAVIERERKEVFERRLSSQQNALANLARGEFFIRTPDEAQNMAFLLGSIFPRPELAISGLYELIINGIEHGNLGLGYEKKGAFLSEGKWEAEIERRLLLADNLNKKVFICFEKFPDRFEITITDDGPGFDWQPYLEIEPSRATHGNGRGIAKANLLGFDEVNYLGPGNQVKIISYTK
ncbi:MAG: hypothetical protein DI586_06240 [Micavibrio aeruginosavorus]|uniref:Response regulatory domain-containing protein n=1 Tax=Micavibrio aeruginosavorus TaxID=349221 RepID=A0A2W5FI98_9BACT|nr:MAG: hypothetical protein DI586_06240 [Micavibrio aeruginosavorus]